MSDQIKNERQTVIYDREKYSSMDIVKLHQQGYEVLCPVCNSKLIFITSLQEARQKDPGHPGIFCPESNDHVYITFSIGSSEIQKRIKDREVKETERERLWEKIALMESEIEELKSRQNKSDEKFDEIDEKINDQRRRINRIALRESTRPRPKSPIAEPKLSEQTRTRPKGANPY